MSTVTGGSGFGTCQFCSLLGLGSRYWPLGLLTCLSGLSEVPELLLLSPACPGPWLPVLDQELGDAACQLEAPASPGYSLGFRFLTASFPH